MSYLFGDLRLYGKNIIEITVVSVRPDLVSAEHIDKLRGNPDPVPGLSHAALHQVLNAQQLRDPGNVGSMPLESESRVACNHEQLPEPGKFGDNVL